MAEEKLTTIWKFPLGLVERQTIKVPRSIRGLHIAVQGRDHRGIDQVCLWAAVDEKAPLVEVEIIIAGTGRPLPQVYEYLGTVQMEGFVWHYFTGLNSFGLNMVGRESNLAYSTRDYD